MRSYLQAVRGGWNVPEAEHINARKLASEVLSDASASERETQLAKQVLAAAPK